MRLWVLPVALLLAWSWSFDAVAQTAPPGTLHYCTGCNFVGSTLSNADFSDVTYVGSTFAGAVLDHASFRGAHLVAANFQSADLRDAVFDDSDCTACNFQDAKLDGASFSGVRIVAANFEGFSSQISDDALRALLAGCVACNFKGASLAGRDLSGVTMIGADLAQADLRNARFNGAVLCWYVVNGALHTTKCITLAGARVTGASFLGVLICADPSEARSCTAVNATALRRDSGSALTGAALP